MKEVGFILSSISKSRKPVKTTYSDDQFDTELSWRLTIRCTFILDRFFEIWCSDDATAHRFPKGALTMTQLFQLLDPLDTGFVVQTITKSTKAFEMNRYTDKREVKESWGVYLQSEKGNIPNIELWFPNKFEAYQFAIGRAYSPPDFLRVFRILIVPDQRTVTAYPADFYVRAEQTEGYFDQYGFHKPGVYPAGYYGAGFFYGRTINLPGSPIDIVNQGLIGYLVFVYSTGFSIIDLKGKQHFYSF